MNRTAVLNLVGLTRSCIGEATPRLRDFTKRNALVSIDPALPAVTCTAQSDYVTGKRPAVHGIVGNGWYHRELAEVQFWKQSNRLVGSPKIWDELRAQNPAFTCAKLFWWYNMYSTADFSITPRPMYPADGRKVFDIYTHPFSIRSDIKKDLGEFPFPTFWGPAAGVDTPQGRSDEVSRWIAQSARWIEEKHQPTLSLVYLPHLDYNFQRFGPGDARVQRDLQQIDVIFGELVDFFSNRGVRVLVVSEYGITSVDTPIHLNRIFRENGWVTIKEELGLELLDAGASRVFAVADHQVAHIYLNDRSLLGKVRTCLEAVPGVGQVLGEPEKTATGLNHPRAGDLIAMAGPKAWFTYYYWFDDRLAPDFARCVDIHRKPGYDPVELFLDPEIPLVKLKIAWRLLQKKLGFRMLMDVIPLDATLVRGSHGRRPENPADWPVFIGPSSLRDSAVLQSTDISRLIGRSVLG
ncbi:MAG: nucleotide pyrophosphatase/phosphodiesterase family protein [Verrucomicrobiota bacterium]